MTPNIKKVCQVARRLHKCERGAEGLEKLLIIAAIVLPLRGLLIVFKNSIMEWVTGTWRDVKQDAGDYQTPIID